MLSDLIRQRAVELRRKVAGSASEVVDVDALLLDAATDLDLSLIPEHPDSANLHGSLAVIEEDCIFYNNKLPDWYRRFCVAHELGHKVVHQSGLRCNSADMEDFGRDDEAPDAEAKVHGYGPHERREREANLFALEFLLPCEMLRTMFVDERLGAAEISARTGFPLDVVYGQMARALLLPVSNPLVEDGNPPPSFDLDESQRRAADAPCGPLLVAAGPGTGKTQTLVRRIVGLLDSGAAPERILALTFSNKAAEEMRERVSRMRPEAAKRLPVMTFHSFGLDLLRRYWKEAKLDKDSALIEKIDAVLHLESKLAELGLAHFKTIYNPAMHLPAILGAISRAKDELVGPEEYRTLGENMLAAAGESEEDRARAEKVLETARVYAFYERWLTDAKKLDFGDLIFRAHRLLDENPGIAAAVRGGYDHVLVDEFQDVNRASGRLLRLVAGHGKGLWCVGDLRQSIYRWRGASPANVLYFGDDFPDAATLALENNYRSGESIVTAFSTFAKSMKSGGGHFSDWSARAGHDGRVTFAVGATRDDEAAHLAGMMLAANREEGVAFRDQAVICRAHSQLARLAERLTAEGVPVLYLGDVFERDEVRDLLAFLDLKASKTGLALVRVAAFPEYAIPPADVRRVLETAGREDSDFRAALSDEPTLGALTPSGREGIARLKAHLDAGGEGDSVWQSACRFLFDDSDHLRAWAGDGSVAAAQKRLALYQFLNFANAQGERFERAGDARIPAFLRHVRKLARLNEDRDFAQVPAAAESLDAVRLLTVHAAKGLEFDTVYMPELAKGTFPGRGRPTSVPEPDGLTDLPKDFRAEEEECLFFVALSRARRHLVLSRPTRKGNTASNASEFVERLESLLPAPVPIIENALPAVALTATEYVRNHFSDSQLKRYGECPRQFYYHDVLGLKERDERSVYRSFHNAVYATIDEIGLRHATGPEIDLASAFARLDEAWTAAGIDDHPYAPIYRAEAEAMVERLCAHLETAAATGDFLRDKLIASLENGKVFLRPQFQEKSAGRVTITTFSTAAPPKEKPDVTDRDAMLAIAAREAFAGLEVEIRNLYLQSGTSATVPVTERLIKSRRERLDGYIERINNGEFPPEKGEKCPDCAFYFVCPS